jgi:molybdenum cofactor cytidylyltransferase
MKLVDALRLTEPIQVGFAGAGGKTTAMFRLARQLPGPVFVTTTTHLGAEQVVFADHHTIVKDFEGIATYLDPSAQGINLMTGPEMADRRLSALDETNLARLHSFCDENGFPLLVEADGSRGLPLKAPASHEPAIPAWVKMVIYLAGMNGINKPLTPTYVHRLAQFKALSGLGEGQTISIDAIIKVLIHPEGGLKKIPPETRRVVMLNQADTTEQQSLAGKIAERAVQYFDAALVSSLSDVGNEIKACFTPIAGIILAAGGSSRFGHSKPLLVWRDKPFIRQVAETAIQAGLDPVIVVTGYNADQVNDAVHGMPVQVVHNANWMSGQSTSVMTGVKVLPARTGAAIFLLADQPQVSPTIIVALMEQHRQNLPPIVAPLIQGKRANPVLFDRSTFPSLMAISGDSGGRQVFSRFRVSWLEWNDANLLLDVDTPEDYQRLLEIQ